MSFLCKEKQKISKCLPIVKSWTGWKRLSVNCSNKQDLPTARTKKILKSISTKTNKYAPHLQITYAIIRLVTDQCRRNVKCGIWAKAVSQIIASNSG